MTTKQKILSGAIAVFNEYGVANVRLQQIADETGISVGNLAYHFKNKDAIVAFVYDHIFKEFSTILSNYLLDESFLDIDSKIDMYYEFFHKYKFFYTDIFEIERNYPTIIAKWHQYINKMLLQIRVRLTFDIQRGSIMAQKDEMSDLIANNVWMSIIFWLPQRILRGQAISEKLYKEAVWSQLIPYLTQKGQDEFVVSIYPQLV